MPYNSFFVIQYTSTHTHISPFACAVDDDIVVVVVVGYVCDCVSNVALPHFNVFVRFGEYFLAVHQVSARIKCRLFHSFSLSLALYEQLKYGRVTHARLRIYRLRAIEIEYSIHSVAKHKSRITLWKFFWPCFFLALTTLSILLLLLLFRCVQFFLTFMFFFDEFMRSNRLHTFSTAI